MTFGFFPPLPHDPFTNPCLSVCFHVGLLSIGQKKGSNVGIYAPNRAEWCTTAVALFCSGMRAVALYDTLGADAVAHIFEHAELEVIFCSKDKVKKVRCFAWLPVV